MTRASVLVPIHDKTLTLPLTVDSVLRQSVEDLEVLLIGDGVTDEVRDVVSALLAGDPRVRFLDLPKGPHHGERYRHDAIEAASTDAIFYLCDDDLLLPDHVADLLALLEDHDLVQCLNGYVTTSGEVRLYAADLSEPDVVALHLRDDLRHNAVSITGTAHTRAAYRRVSRWDTTPAGWWPDHWQFRKMLGPGFRAATSRRMTALQFPTSDGREDWDDRARADEIVPWHALVTSPGAQAEVDRLVADSLFPQLVEERGLLSQLAADRTLAMSEREALGQEVERLHAELGEARAAVADLRAALPVVHEHLARERALRLEREAKIEELQARLRRSWEVMRRLRAQAPGRRRRRA